MDTNLQTDRLTRGVSTHGHTCGGHVPGVFSLPYLVFFLLLPLTQVLFFVVLSTPAALLLGVTPCACEKVFTMVTVCIT